MVQIRAMHRKRQQLSDEETIALRRHATSGVLSVLDEDGHPYGVPISYVYDNNKLYFHSALIGHKIGAIRHSDKASFTIICKDEIHPETFTTYFRSVVCFGHVRLIEDETEKKYNALHLLGKQYNPDDEPALEAEIKKGLGHVAVIEFDIEHVTGKEAIELVRQRQGK